MIKDRQAASLERLAFFSDAVFAIAMTLLVIDVRVPHLEDPNELALGNKLAALIPNYIGFIVSFVVVGRFWLGHHRNLGMLQSVPPGLFGANLLLLLSIAFMPFPTAVLCNYVNLSVAGVFYSLWLVVMGFANMQFVHTALRDPARLHPEVSTSDVRLSRTNCWIPIIAGALAAAVSVLSAVIGVMVLVAAAPLLGWLARHMLSARFSSTDNVEQ